MSDFKHMREPLSVICEAIGPENFQRLPASVWIVVVESLQAHTGTAQLLSGLMQIAGAEPIDGDTVVCDFDTLQGIARHTIREFEGAS